MALHHLSNEEIQEIVSYDAGLREFYPTIKLERDMLHLHACSDCQARLRAAYQAIVSQMPQIEVTGEEEICARSSVIKDVLQRLGVRRTRVRRERFLLQQLLEQADAQGDRTTVENYEAQAVLLARFEALFAR